MDSGSHRWLERRRKRERRLRVAADKEPPQKVFWMDNGDVELIVHESEGKNKAKVPRLQADAPRRMPVGGERWRRHDGSPSA